MPNEKLYTRMQAEISSLATSINDIVSKFKGLHNPLEESSERVPQATQQLDKISRETEAATHQMLDRIEGITQREEEVMKGLQDLKQQIADGRLADADRLIDSLLEKSDTTCNDAFTIMESLQFQDITTQQVNHAASLLEDIETRLHGILAVLDGSEECVDAGSDDTDRRPRVFDPHADLSDKRTVQADIDSLFAQKK